MLHALNRKTVLIGSLALMSVMFIIVMFVVNPSIDGGNGAGVIKLQLSFEKDFGIKIINSWGKAGTENFNLWIVMDYIYALAYSVFFASLLSFLILKKGMENSFAYKSIVYLAFIAGFLDWIENTIEFIFVNNPSQVSNTLFFLHSIVALVKWAVFPIAVACIVVLLTKRNKCHIPDDHKDACETGEDGKLYQSFMA